MPKVSVKATCHICNRETGEGITINHEGMDLGFCTNRHYVEWWRTLFDDTRFDPDDYESPEEKYGIKDGGIGGNVYPMNYDDLKNMLPDGWERTDAHAEARMLKEFDDHAKEGHYLRDKNISAVAVTDKDPFEVLMQIDKDNQFHVCEFKSEDGEHFKIRYSGTYSQVLKYMTGDIPT